MQAISMMVKLPPRRVIDASPRFPCMSNKTWLTLETIPGRSFPTNVSINQFSISLSPIDQDNVSYTKTIVTLISPLCQSIVNIVECFREIDERDAKG